MEIVIGISRHGDDVLGPFPAHTNARHIGGSARTAVFTPLNSTQAGTSGPFAFHLEGNPDFLSRFRAGECDALACVYERYFHELVRSMRMGFALRGTRYIRIAGLPDEAARQDAVHDAFVRAFSEPARLRYDGVRPYRAFLARIARNVQIDDARQRRREVPLGAMDGNDVVGTSVTQALTRHWSFDVESLEPEQALDWARRRRATLEYVAELTFELRQFAQLRYVEDLSQAEVARTMAITRRRVRTLEQRLLGGLRRRLLRKSLARQAQGRSGMGLAAPPGTHHGEERGPGTAERL
jgi:RNA polymerase sigma factor (sigma-70 family)